MPMTIKARLHLLLHLKHITICICNWNETFAIISENQLKALAGQQQTQTKRRPSVERAEQAQTKRTWRCDFSKILLISLAFLIRNETLCKTKLGKGERNYTFNAMPMTIKARLHLLLHLKHITICICNWNETFAIISENQLKALAGQQQTQTKRRPSAHEDVIFQILQICLWFVIFNETQS